MNFHNFVNTVFSTFSLARPLTNRRGREREGAGHQVKLGSGKDRFVNLLVFSFEMQIRIKTHSAIAQANQNKMFVK